MEWGSEEEVFMEEAEDPAIALVQEEEEVVGEAVEEEEMVEVVEEEVAEEEMVEEVAEGEVVEEEVAEVEVVVGIDLEHQYNNHILYEFVFWDFQIKFWLFFLLTSFHI